MGNFILYIVFFFTQKKLKLHSRFFLFAPQALPPPNQHTPLVPGITFVLSCFHSYLQLSLLCIHRDKNGQASWLHLKRHTYQGAPPPTPTPPILLQLSFSFRLKHGPCQCTGWIYHSLSLFVSGSAVAATTRLCGSVKV